MNQESFEKTIIGMMAEYDITMFDALLWDFETFLLDDAEKMYIDSGAAMLENRFRKYLSDSGVSSERKDFYADVFMGRAANMELNANAKTKNQ